MTKQIVILGSCLLLGMILLVLCRNNLSAINGPTAKQASAVAKVSQGLTGVESIPFTLTDANNISISAVLNDSDRLELMFHTAVDSISLISESAAKMPSLKLNDTANIESWGGKAELGVSTGNRLQIGNFQWDNQTIFVDRFSGPGTVGKFGPNLFAGKIIEIHFDRSELRIHESLPANVTRTNSEYQRLDITEDHGSMYVVGEVVVDNVPLDHAFMLHSGFGGSLLLDDDFVQKHQLTSKLETISERELTDALGNKIKTKKVKLQSLSIAGYKFADVPIELFDGRLGNQKVSILGGEMLKRFNLFVDQANRHLYLAKR